MSKAFLLCLVTCGALGFTTLHLVSELRTERATVQELQTRIAQLERSGATPPAPTSLPMAAPAAAAALPAQIPPAQEKGRVVTSAMAVNVSNGASVGGVDQPSLEESQRMFRQHVERQQALMRDPQYRQAMITQHKMVQRQTNPDLAQDLGLTAEQADRLFTLLAEQQLRTMQDASAFGPVPASNVQELQRKFQEQQAANEAEIANLLGDAKLQAWKEYQSTLPVRHEVTQLRNTLASRGVPLDTELGRSVLQVMADEHQQFIRESERRFALNRAPDLAAASPTRHLEMQEQHYEQIAKRYERQRDALSGLLTAEQLRILEEEQNAQLQMQRAQLQLMRAQMEAEARGEIAPVEVEAAPAVLGVRAPGG